MTKIDPFSSVEQPYKKLNNLLVLLLIKDHPLRKNNCLLCPSKPLSANFSGIQYICLFTKMKLFFQIIATCQATDMMTELHVIFLGSLYINV